MPQRSTTTSILTQESTLPPLSEILIWAAARIARWSQRSRTRHHLKDLPPHVLRDVGLTRAQAEAESMKRFWMP